VSFDPLPPTTSAATLSAAKPSQDLSVASDNDVASTVNYLTSHFDELNKAVVLLTSHHAQQMVELQQRYKALHKMAALHSSTRTGIATDQKSNEVGAEDKKKKKKELAVVREKDESGVQFRESYISSVVMIAF
jgi:hypothetical protein